MYSILFVCHGNICRSPMAEFIMRDLCARAGCADDFEIASAATSGEEIGNPVYPPARRELARHHLSCAGKTARRIVARDYQEYNLLIGMEELNIRNMLRFFGDDPLNKLSLLPAYAGLDHGIEDPWYSGDFAAAYRDIETGCRALLRALKPGACQCG